MVLAFGSRPSCCRHKLKEMTGHAMFCANWTTNLQLYGSLRVCWLHISGCVHQLEVVLAISSMYLTCYALPWCKTQCLVPAVILTVIHLICSCCICRQERLLLLMTEVSAYAWDCQAPHGNACLATHAQHASSASCSPQHLCENSTNLDLN